MFGKIGEGDKEFNDKESPKNRFGDFKELVNEAIKDPEGTPDRYSIVELSPELNYQVMTEKRTQLLQVLKQEPEIDSISELTERVERRLGAVYWDLKMLKNYGFVDLVRQGRKKTLELVSG